MGIDITVPIRCEQCRLEFNALISADGKHFCERCHIELLYRAIRVLENKIKRLERGIY